MVLRMYSVLDMAAGAYLPPFYERADGSAVRAVVTAARDVKHAFGRSPSDYVLFCVGEFDDADGVVHPTMPHRLIGKVVDLVSTVADGG